MMAQQEVKQHYNQTLTEVDVKILPLGLSAWANPKQISPLFLFSADNKKGLYL